MKTNLLKYFLGFSLLFATADTVVNNLEIEELSSSLVKSNSDYTLYFHSDTEVKFHSYKSNDSFINSNLVATIPSRPILFTFRYNYLLPSSNNDISFAGQRLNGLLKV